jgi:hypothetical protein
MSKQQTPYSDDLTDNEKTVLRWMKRNQEKAESMDTWEIEERFESKGIYDVQVSDLFDTREWAVFTDTLEEWIADGDEDRPRW